MYVESKRVEYTAKSRMVVTRAWRWEKQGDVRKGYKVVVIKDERV